MRFVLGAGDPEMVLIKGIVGSTGHEYVRALDEEGRRVTPRAAYRVTFPKPEAGDVWVECAPLEGGRPALDREGIVRVDHHAAGDPGFGVSPDRFLEASSVGQVVALVADRLVNDWESRPIQASDPDSKFFFDGEHWFVRAKSHLALRVRNKVVLAAASDHCPGAAYAGRCPGVQPRHLQEFRLAGRSAKGVEQAKRTLESAPVLEVDGLSIADLRDQDVPYLSEACMQLGRAALYALPPGHRQNKQDTRVKVGIIGCGEGSVPGTAPAEWLLSAENPLGLEDRYGDPVRGYAGGYFPRGSDA